MLRQLKNQTALSEEEMGVCVDNQTSPARSVNESKLTKPTSIESLPDDVVFDIHARIPAHNIYYAAKLVCSKWYQMTRTNNFVRAHLHQSEYGLLIQHAGSEKSFFDQSTKPPILFATQKGHRIIEISDFDFKFEGVVLTSCNGLVLECYYKVSKFEFRIKNPATNRHLDLPSNGRDTAFHCFAMGMAYAAASNKYKVIHSIYSKSEEVECAILTVGVDEDWNRRVDIQHLSPTAKLLLKKIPSTTEGFVHWAPQDGSGRYPECVLTLNVETEIITQFQALPPSLFCGFHGKTKLLYSYLPMGSCLSLLIAHDNYKFPIWDQVWVMKPETGEWTKMMSIDSESQKRAFEGVSVPLNCKLRPVGWLKFREVLVFRDVKWSSRNEICIAYNVHTHEIESFKLDHFSSCRLIVHRNSLVWLDGC